MFFNQTDTQTISATFLQESAALSKVVVREMHSGLYLNEAGLLTQEIENAKRFDSATVALQEASSLKLEAAEIVSLDKSSPSPTRRSQQWGRFLCVV